MTRRSIVPATMRTPRADSLARVVLAEVQRVREEHDIVRPLAHEQGMLDRVGPNAEHADRLVANLPAVAVRTVQQVATPTLPNAGDVREFVSDPRGQQDPLRREAVATGQRDREAPFDGDHVVRRSGRRHIPDLAAAGRQEFGRRHAVA